MFNPNKKKCFTFTWTLENISYCWEKSISCPTFTIRALQGSEYSLNLNPRGLENDDFLDFYLHKLSGSSVRTECELELLSRDGSVLVSRKTEMSDDFVSFSRFKERNEVFVVNRSVYLPQDKLTIRCRIWTSEGEMTEDVQCFARTRICIESNSFLWNIKNFSNLQPEEKRTYQIKSVLNDKLLMTIDLFSRNMYTDEDSMTMQLVDENGKIKHLVFYVTPLSGFGSANKSIRKEFQFCKNKESKLLTLPFSKKELISNKNMCLPNDVLSVRCDCTFSTGKVIAEIESVNYDCDRFEASDLNIHCLDERNTVSESKRVFNENLKSLFHDSLLSDIKLKTSIKTYFAHKSILSARSPVFKAMFENNMKERLNECVDIQDLESDTVCRMLQYVYTAEIQDLQWDNACNLYRAADKYEILALRDECSAFLKSNLCSKNACEVLILADLHQDEELKAATQDFIFNHDVVSSEEWKQLMKSHVKLAIDTMYLQIQRKTKKFPDYKQLPVASGFGSSSAKILSTFPGFYSINEKMMSTTSELNKRTGTIPSCSSGLGSNVEVKPFLPPCPLVSSGRTTSTSTGFKNCLQEKSLPISFDNSSEKTSFKPSISLAISSENLPTKQSFSFGNTDEKKPIEPSFSFGISSANLPTKPLFLFGNTDEKKPVEPSLSFGISSANLSTKPSFSFGNTDEKKPVEPSFSFGSNNTLTKPSFSFRNRRNKTPVKPPFTFHKDLEKASSLSPGVTISKEQTSSIIHASDSCSFSKPNLSVESTSTAVHSTFPGLKNSNSKTPSLSVEFKSTNGGTPRATSELDGTAIKTSETTEIGILLSPLLINPMSVNAPNASSELNCAKEPTQSESPALDSSSSEMLVSFELDNITLKTESNYSVFDNIKGNLSTSPGLDKSIAMTPFRMPVLDNVWIENPTTSVAERISSRLENITGKTPAETPSLDISFAETDSS